MSEAEGARGGESVRFWDQSLLSRISLTMSSCDIKEATYRVA